MKSVLFVCFFVCFAGALAEVGEERWLNFKNQHAKSYKNIQEEKLRFSIFQANVKTIEEHNRRYEAGKETYTLAVNKFADFTLEELRDRYLTHKKRPEIKSKIPFEKPEGVPVPDSIDWREKGAVTSVKDQRDCGGCWAFSTVASVEGFYFLNSGKLVDLSPQQLIDCTNNDKYNNFGCSGGDEPLSLQYIQEYGIIKQSDYPFIDKDGKCSYNASLVETKINGYVTLPSFDEDKLKEAVGLLGPISVGMDANYVFFYDGGVYNDDSKCDHTTPNHAILAVGYGHDEASGLDYWLLKNSWGENWADNGYFKVQRGVNMCAIASDSCYPTY